MAKVDRDRAIIKALDRAPLTLTEIEELSAVGAYELFEFGLRHEQVRTVQSHCRHEAQRHQYQVQFHKLGDDGTRSAVMESRARKIRVSKRELQKIIREEVEYAQARKILGSARNKRR